MNRNFKSSKNRFSLPNNKEDLIKYILIGAAALLLIAVIVIVIVVSAQSCNGAPPTDDNFTEVNEKAYIYSDQDGDGKCDGRCNEEGQDAYIVNLYPEPVRETIARSLPCGTELTRIGILIENAEGDGWSKVEYAGKVYYIRNSCVTTTKPHTSSAGDEAVG